MRARCARRGAASDALRRRLLAPGDGRPCCGRRCCAAAVGPPLRTVLAAAERGSASSPAGGSGSGVAGNDDSGSELGARARPVSGGDAPVIFIGELVRSKRGTQHDSSARSPSSCWSAGRLLDLSDDLRHLRPNAFLGRRREWPFGAVAIGGRGAVRLVAGPRAHGAVASRLDDTFALHPRAARFSRRRHLSAHARLQSSAALVTQARRLRRVAALHGGVVRDKGQLVAERALRRPHGLAHPDPLPDPETVRRAIELRLHVPPSSSRAHRRVEGLPPPARRDNDMAHSARRLRRRGRSRADRGVPAAALHLESTGAEDGGWGYNRRVAVDCDSTAQALLVLHRFRRDVPVFLLETLVLAQLREGGFPTYATNGAVASGWHAAHPDVTAIAVEMLSRHGRAEAAERAARWLEAQDPSSGFAELLVGRSALRSLGARTCGLAATGCRRRGGGRASRDENRASRRPGVGCSSGVCTSARRNIRDGSTSSCGLQLGDGSWPCAVFFGSLDPQEHVTHSQLRGTSLCRWAPISDRTCRRCIGVGPSG